MHHREPRARPARLGLDASRSPSDAAPSNATATSRPSASTTLTRTACGAASDSPTVTAPPDGFGHTDTPTEAGVSGSPSLDTGFIASTTGPRDRYDHDALFPIRAVPAYSRPSGPTSTV